MQRRSFLKNAACVGACATLLAPLTDVWADTEAAPEVAMRLQRTGAGSAAPGATALRVRATPVQFDAGQATLRVRAWLATDAGPRAFDIASFGRSGGSQRLRFALEPRRLIGFEAATGQRLDDCACVAACAARGPLDAGLEAGSYRLWLSQGGRDIAAVDLEVAAHAFIPA